MSQPLREAADANRAPGFQSELGEKQFLEEFYDKRPGLRGEVSRINAEALATGKKQKDWTEVGTSFRGVFDSAGGAPETHVIGTWRQGGRGMHLFGVLQPPETIFPFHYSVYGSARGNTASRHQFYRISNQIFLHTWARLEEKDSVHCFRDEGLEVLAKTPKANWSEEELLLTMSAAAFTSENKTTEYCISYMEEREGRFYELVYDSTGRPFTAYTRTGYVMDVVERAIAIDEYFGL